MAASTQTTPRSGAPAGDGGVTGLVTDRAKSWSVEGPNTRFMATQRPLWAFLCDHYFRVEIHGWHRLPDEPTLLVGNHSGGPLTMDTWTLSAEWWRRFEQRRILHATAHDVLMTLPGLGDYFRAAGVIPASREGVTAALEAGHDVIVWPGGDLDAMRAWRKRDQVVLGERRGFVRQAISSGVPIMPVATVGGHDTVFILSEGRRIASAFDRLFGLKRMLRGENFPIILGFPFGITPEIFPVHIPLPAKIRTELMQPLHLDTDPDRADDEAYVNRMYSEVEQRLQAGVDRLAERRSFPIFG